MATPARRSRSTTSSVATPDRKKPPQLRTAAIAASPLCVHVDEQFRDAPKMASKKRRREEKPPAEDEQEHKDEEQTQQHKDDDAQAALRASLVTPPPSARMLDHRNPPPPPRFVRKRRLLNPSTDVSQLPPPRLRFHPIPFSSISSDPLSPPVQDRIRSRFSLDSTRSSNSNSSSLSPPPPSPSPQLPLPPPVHHSRPPTPRRVSVFRSLAAEFESAADDDHLSTPRRPLLRPPPRIPRRTTRRVTPTRRSPRRSRHDASPSLTMVLRSRVLDKRRSV